jgi:predicted translin family RNA/ssDNA-binding protein
MTSTRSTALPIFETFRDELDEHHDRRERIIKTSRDITALSKKMYALPLVSTCLALTNAAHSIFALQR